MEIRSVSRDYAVLKLSHDELVLLYGGLIEAAEALSAAEFRARVGRPEEDCEKLRASLKPVLKKVEEMRRTDPQGGTS
jgi:hypothetical protein